MQLIESYQPEYVARFVALQETCNCPKCKAEQGEYPRVTQRFQNQERESLMLGCESAVRETLLNPEAFVLHPVQTQAMAKETLSPWLEQVNQQCINLTIQRAMNLECSLYAIGVLLSKAQTLSEQGDESCEQIASMGEQLMLLADQNVLQQQLGMLPPIVESRLEALQGMGALRLNLNLPLPQKMPMMLKLSELSIMQPARLAERLQELEAAWQTQTLFTEQPYILRNALLYSLYHHVFPGIDAKNYGESFLALVRHFFRLKMLCAMWLTDNEQLTEENVVTLFSAYFAWQATETAQFNADQTADYSLLTGLALI